MNEKNVKLINKLVSGAMEKNLQFGIPDEEPTMEQRREVMDDTFILKDPKVAIKDLKERCQENAPIGSEEEAVLLQKYRSKKQKYNDKRNKNIERQRLNKTMSHFLTGLDFMSQYLGGGFF